MHSPLPSDERSVFTQQREVILAQELERHRAFPAARRKQKQDSAACVSHAHCVNTVKLERIDMLTDSREEKQVHHLSQHVEVRAVHHAALSFCVKYREASAEIIDVS